MDVPGQVTNPENLNTQELMFTSNNSAVKAFLARPKAPGHDAAALSRYTERSPISW